MATASKEINLRVSISNRQILSIALPITAAIIVPQVNFIINNIFLGGLGQKSLALAGITGVYYLVFAVAGHGLNNGLQALISRRAGENRIADIGNLFAQGVRIALVFAVIGIAITWFVAPYVLRWSLHDAESVRVCVNFLNIRILGLPFLYVYQMRNALLVGTNQSKYLIIGTATEGIVNIFFDYALIYGKFGMPALGFEGAAYASIIAEFSGLVVIYWVIRYYGITRQLQLFRNWKYDIGNIRLILQQSYPLILQHVISVGSWEFFYILIEHHGERDLAISNAMRNIFGFFGCFTWAFAATANTMVSNVIGQQLQSQVKKLIYRIMYWSMGFALAVFLFLNAFPHIFLSIYGQGDAFIQAAIPVTRVVSSALVLMSVSVVWMNAVTGTGNSKINLFSEIAAISFYCAYVYTVLEVMHMPITWGWASEWIYWMTILIPSFFYISSNRWKTKTI
ncbi:MATE family efflux transporter [Sediminibacterium soli]|uniref:MATE family efflux transporter n=1 Tax=Sediminibacterium soli TaxID=2698829 RepID=UPI0013798DA8|nr:MATE family efflux transporter [Sediminibacterium soli]NCI46302.1 MATE family efflux transporter [Sediminibacterium soli]